MSSGNTFYHNNFTDNYADTYWSDSSFNNWNSSYPEGGNYWDRYVDRMVSHTDIYNGPYQNLAGADGFWDSPYPVNGEGSLDYYPIVPEYPTGLVTIPLALMTLIAALVYRRRNTARAHNGQKT